jgi:hypothetical protein
MSILNKLLGTAQSAARGQAYGRTTGRPVRGSGMGRGAGMGRGTGMGRGIGMARRPAPRRGGSGRTPSTAAGGLGGLLGGLLRRR